MEQKKLLLVAISVGVFFVIVIGTALVFLRKPAADIASAGGIYSGGISYIGAGNLSTAVAEPARDLGGPAAPVSESGENPDDTKADDQKDALDSGKAIAGASPQSGSTEDSSAPIIRFGVDSPQAAGVPNAAVAQRTAAPAVRPAETRPAAAAPRAAATAPAPTRAASPAPSRTRDDYWVQTGAFTALSRAESVKQTLADRGITSIIENRNVGNTLYFRVRIGPYTSENEADYWLGLIKSIDGFEESQIRKTQTSL